MTHRIDRYEIVRKLATGGMADVFLALQWGDGGFVREVVVKRLHAHVAAQTTLLEDFRNEADLLARLGGRGIPHIFEFRCSAQREWYVAMEHVRGPTLTELVHQTADGARLPLPVALSIGVSLSEILDDVHDCTDPFTGSELGVVHGDITPTNIVANARGRLHLLDFGIAGGDKHRLKRRGGEHGIRGTLGYFAPESTESGAALPDRRADVFSFGALLYELVTGQPAFPRVALEYLNAIHTGPATRPCEVDGSLPPELDDLLMQCLSPDPAQRPARAGLVGDILRKIAEEEGLHAGRSTLADYVDTYFPEQEDAPTRVGAPERGFVVALPDATQNTESESNLSEDERDELLADLALFAPEGAAFLEPEPLPSLVPEAPRRPPPPPPPPPPSATRAVRQEKATPVAFPAVSDLASSGADTQPPYAAADTAPPSGALRRSESRRKQVAHPDSDTPLEAKSPPPDSGGFYIYVAEED